VILEKDTSPQLFLVKNKFFETIRCVDGEVLYLPYHQQRYEGVLKFLGVSKSKQLEHYLSPPKNGLYKCRVVYSKDDIEVSYQPYVKRNVKSLKIIHDDSIEYYHKYLDRSQIEKLFLHREDCDDILIVKNGLLTDTSIANLALYKDGIWFTPTKPLLRGTTRERLLDEGILQEKNIHQSELHQFSKFALLNAMIGFDIISQIEFVE